MSGGGSGDAARAEVGCSQTIFPWHGPAGWVAMAIDGLSVIADGLDGDDGSWVITLTLLEDKANG